MIHNYVTNRNVNISQTVTKQIVISSKKYPKKIPTVFEEISSSKGAPGILLDLQRFKFLNILCVWLEQSEQQAHDFLQYNRVQMKFWQQYFHKRRKKQKE